MVSSESFSLLGSPASNTHVMKGSGCFKSITRLKKGTDCNKEIKSFSSIFISDTSKETNTVHLQHISKEYLEANRKYLSYNFNLDYSQILKNE